MEANVSPLISVVVPVYNTEKYIANTIASLKNQTFQNFEIIFVDDGTPDNSLAVIERELSETQIKHSIVRQPNSGLGIARNTGVSHANGDWVLFLDSDDILSRHCLERYANAIQKNPDAEFLFSKFQYVEESTPFLEAPPNDTTIVLNEESILKGFLTRKLTILVPGSLYKISMLKENNIWHTSIRWSEDQHFMWQVLNSIRSGIFLEACLYNYLQRSEGSSIMNSTPVDPMLVAYESFCALAKDMKNEMVRDLFVSRWVLGCLNVLAHRNDKQAWRVFFEKTEGQIHLKKLCSFPDFKVRMLSFIGCISNRVMYALMKHL